jgi:hypothetical protein
LFEKRQVVFWNQNGLCLSISRELDPRAGSRSSNEARQILARRCGCYLLGHAAKVVSSRFRSTAGVRLLTYSSRVEKLSRVFAVACAFQPPRFAREAILGRR